MRAHSMGQNSTNGRSAITIPPEWMPRWRGKSSSSLVIGTSRPALAIPLPVPGKPVTLLDVGANAESRAEHLVQFAFMGAALAHVVLGIDRPRIGLLSNGEEEMKGTPLVREAHEVLAGSQLQFVGNVEGLDITSGVADVIVTDGFTGNVALKSMEGAVSALTQVLREEVTKGIVRKALALMLKPALREVRLRLDYEEIGGAPLLGVNGAVIVAHGRSHERAIANAVRVASRTASQNIPAEIARSIQAGGASAEVSA